MITLAAILALHCAPLVHRTAYVPRGDLLTRVAACQTPRMEVGPYVVVRRGEGRT